MAVSKVIFGNTTVMDITDSTVSASKLKSGETAYGADGTKITGSLVVPDVLDDLSDVVITSPQTAQEIYFDGTEWINYGAKIILTFDDDFRGQTITLTKGQTTITKTAPLSGNTMNLYVNETGTWTISSEISEITYETEVNVTTFGTSFDAELNSAPPVPQGSVVTPIDDIQTWLHCANIWDKSYTTLAEVLADRSTFETLIADSNACDYMARSTSWALAEGTVPTMTGYTTPSGEVVYLNPYSAYYPWKAFDGDDSSLGTVVNNVGNYIGYIFTEPKIIKTVFAHTVGLGTWKIQGRISGNWEDLATLSSTTDGGTYSVNIDLNDEIDAIRLYLNAKTGTTSGVGFYTLQFYEADITRNQDAMALIGKYDYCSNALLGNATWAEAIVSSDCWDSVCNISVPKMTSNTAPSGEVIYSSVYSSSYPAYYAFDKNNSTFWSSQSSGNQYVGYKFTSAVNIKALFIYPNLNAGTTYELKLQGSNDNSTWTDIKTFEIDGLTQTYISVTNNNSYLYYRVLREGGWQAFTIQFYGRSTNEVLVPLVPTMTSNTTPSGECSASMIYGNIQPYVAFDNNTSTKWVAGQDVGSTPTIQWIQYHWGSSKIVNAIKWRANTDSPYLPPTQITIKGSNDGIDFISITTISDITADANEYFVEFENTIAYSYIRLELTTRTYRSSNYAQFSEIQFYQRTVQTNIVHSSANDTIYYMEDSSPVIVATTNSDGDGILDFSSLEDKEYTFYSSVAKDPSNLSNDFSKTVRITKSEFGGTTEMYLMPDTVKTLYWWGYKNNIESMVTSNGWSRSSYTFNAPTYNTNYVDCYGNGNTVISGVSSTYKPTLMDRMCTIAQGVTAVNSSYGNIKTEPSKAIDGSSATRQTLYDTNTLKFYVNTNPISDNYFTSYTIANRRCNLYGMWYE